MVKPKLKAVDFREQLKENVWEFVKRLNRMRETKVGTYYTKIGFIYYILIEICRFGLYVCMSG